VAELVGTEALQDPERLVLETARLLREGFLRQSAVDPVDASCPPPKALELLRAILELHARAGAALAKGVPLRAIIETGAGARVLRLVQVPAPEIRAAAGGLRSEVHAALERLEAE
jgi:V/A-type H+-transporting ATPase subunit A